MPLLFNDSSFQQSANPKRATGFPSPADDFFEQRLDLNEQFIKHQEATFFARMVGDAMVNAGIHDGDLLIVDRSLPIESGQIVIAYLNGDFTVKRLQRRNDQITLLSENPRHRPITITEGQDLIIWGVVTTVIHRL